MLQGTIRYTIFQKINPYFLLQGPVSDTFRELCPNFAPTNFEIVAKLLVIDKIFVHKVLDLQKTIAVFSLKLLIFEKFGFFIKTGQKCLFCPFQIDISAII